MSQTLAEVADQESLHPALALSQQMLEQARAGSWSEVGQLNAERQALLVTLLQPSAAAGNPDIAALLRSVTTLHKEVEQLAEIAREEAVVAMAALKNRQQAIAQYSAT